MTPNHVFFYENLLKLQKKVVILQAQLFKLIKITSYKKHKKIDI